MISNWISKGIWSDIMILKMVFRVYDLIVKMLVVFLERVYVWRIYIMDIKLGPL